MTNPLLLRDSDPLYFQQSDFVGPGESRVFHGFFSRRGGESRDIYASLNCGPGSDDEQNLVQKNRKIVCEEIGCTPEHLLSVHQVHGAQCHIVREAWRMDERPQGDAMVSDVPGLALGVLTADCAPVLFAGEKDDGSPVVAAAHAGWGAC